MNDKMAFVTGAANGIGRGLALALGERGYRVIVCDTSLDEAAAVVKEIESNGGTAVPRCCDVTRSEEVQVVANLIVAQFGVPPDFVFGNVGSTVDKPLLDYTKEDWRWLLEVNVVAAWDTARIFARAALDAERPCRLIFTAWERNLGYQLPGLAGYATSTNALLALAEGLRAELADRVHVSVLCPSLAQSIVGAAESFRPGHIDAPSPLKRVDMVREYDALEVGRIAVDGAERGDFIIATFPQFTPPSFNVVPVPHRARLDPSGAMTE